jgi:hypothetical protein
LRDDGVHVAEFRGLAVGDLADDAGVETGREIGRRGRVSSQNPAREDDFKVLVGIYHADRSFDFHTGEK